MDFKILKIKDWFVKFSIDGVKFLWHTERDEDDCIDRGVLSVFKHGEFGRYELKDVGRWDRLYLSRPSYGLNKEPSRANKDYRERIRQDLSNELGRIGLALEELPKIIERKEG